MENEKSRVSFQIGRFRLLVLSVIVCLLLMVTVPKNVFGSDGMAEKADFEFCQKENVDFKKYVKHDELVDQLGGFQYKYPLNLPKGTNDIAPSLTLVYNSQENENGMVGIGWFLHGITEIKRDFSYGVNFNDQDHFTYDGEKLIKGNDGYYHLEKEGYERIRAVNLSGSDSYWEVTLKNGTKMYFGYQASEHSSDTFGRIYAAKDGNKVYLWSLSKVIDVHGNYYLVEYNHDRENGDFYPVRIIYTKNGKKPLPSVRTVEFYYESRTDRCVLYNPTYMDMDRRLKWITIKFGNNLLKKYRLDYEYGTASYLSRLVAIQEYGCDGDVPSAWPWVDSSYTGTGKTLPATKFDWQKGSAYNIYQPYSRHDKPLSGVNFTPGDYNGDGKTDVIMTSPNGSYWYLSTGTGNSYSPYQPFSRHDLTLGSENYTPGDFNGDGKTDLILTTKSGSYWYISTGTGNSYSPYQAYSRGDLTLGSVNYTPGDFNGDGKTDLIVTTSSGSYWYISTGTGNSYSPYQAYSRGDLTLGSVNYTPGDFNGDGKTDLILTTKSGSYWYISTGTGDSYSPYQAYARYDLTLGSVNYTPGDFNGDGKTDVIMTSPNGSYWYISTGTGDLFGTYQPFSRHDLKLGSVGFTQGDFNGDGKTDVIMTSPNGSYWYISTWNGNSYSPYQPYSRDDKPLGEVAFTPADMNGDGKTDVIMTSLSGSYWYISVGTDYFPPDILKTIKTSKGATITITYTPSVDVAGAVNSDETTYPNVSNRNLTALVTQITQDDGLGRIITDNYNYSKGMLHVGRPYERAYLGFSWLERKNALTGSVRTYYRQDDVDLRLKVDKEEVYGTDGKLYIEIGNVYQKRENTNDPTIKFIYPEKEIIKNYNGEDGIPVTYQVEYGFDAYGNPTLIDDSGDIAVAGDETRIERNFNQYIDSTTYLFLPEYERKYGIKLNGEEGLAGENRYFYNTNYDRERVEKENGGQDVVIQYGYDDYGNVTSMTDGNGNTTTCTYDDKYQTFLRTQTLKFTEETIYDDLMRPIKKKDANGQTWETTYDVFSREKSRVSPGDTIASPTTKITYPDECVDTNGNPIFPQCKKTEKKIADGNCIEVYTYTDGLDRVIQEKTESRNGWITVDHIYDGAGREAQTSMPYFTTSSSYTAPSSDVKYTTLTFDPIGRLAKTESPDQTKICQYYGKQETLTVDPLGHVTNKRIVGNIEENINYTGVYPNQVEYSKTATINACDGMKKVDAFGKEFITTIDMLGRTTKSVTPVNGTWSYSFDANNNLKTQTDAKNQKIALDYDSLNRLTKKSYPDGSSVNYYYDETGHGYANGLLTRVEYPGGSESYTYDTRGRKTEVTQTIGGIGKTKKFTYNSLDQVVTQTLPDGEVVTNSYDTGGMLSGLKGSSTYLTDVNYYASAKISKMAYGNGVRTDYDYYDNAGENDPSAGINFSYRLKQIRVYKTSDLLNLTYEYDKSDNVKVKRDSINAKYTETYGYDDLSRLISANSTSYGSKTFQYDKINNITLKDNRTYQYDTVNPYKLVNDGQYSYTYDANGSMINRNDGRVIGWDYENRVKSISGGSGYEYNAGGQRIKKVEGDITKLYFFADYEEEYKAGVKTKTVKYYFAYKLRVAENSTTTGVRYYHKDHLSSSTVITDTNGSLVRRIIYAPYGSESASEGTAEVSYKYTDKEKDTTGLYYFGARFYDPEVGRFITVDPGKDGLNWYAYCDNNPIRFIDPNGFATTDPAAGYITPRTAREIAFALTHPVAALAIGTVERGSTNISTNATRFSTQLGLKENVTHEGSQVNAYRHSLWQATITSRFGLDIAFQVGNAHETNPFAGGGFSFNTLAAADQTADLRNNFIGRSIGAAMGSGASMKAIASKVLDHYHEYGLWTASQQKDGSYTVGLTKLTDEEYEEAKDSLSDLDENGW